MDNLIDDSYFWGKLRIGNIVTITTQNTAHAKAVEEKKNEITGYITRYQSKFLKMLLGDEVYKNPPQAIIDLIVDSKARISPLANYVFCMYQIENMSFATPSGEKKLTAPDTVEEDVRFKVANAWNDMVDLNQIIHQTMYEAQTTGGKNYLNDILDNMDVCVEYVLRGNKKQTIILEGAIFNKRSKYDFNK